MVQYEMYFTNEYVEEIILYDSTNDEVKTIISQTEDREILYTYTYNYNWDNGFEIPQIYPNGLLL